jgi:16S rRNA processing protein RimM
VDDPGGAPLGLVVDLMETGGGATVLVVRGPEGELLIPLADAFVKQVDVAGGRLVAERPEFLPHREGSHAH